MAGVLLALGIAAGALGTHVLRARLSPEQLDVFETAVRYHLYNALGLLGLGAVRLSHDSQLLRWSGAPKASSLLRSTFPPACRATSSLVSSTWWAGRPAVRW